MYVIWHQCSIIKHNQCAPSIDTANWTLGPFLHVLPLCQAAHSLFGFRASTVRRSSQISHTVGILLHAVFGQGSTVTSQQEGCRFDSNPGHFCMFSLCIGEKELKLNYQPYLTTIDLIPIPLVLLIFLSTSLSFPSPHLTVRQDHYFRAKTKDVTTFFSRLLSWGENIVFVTFNIRTPMLVSDKCTVEPYRNGIRYAGVLSKFWATEVKAWWNWGLSIKLYFFSCP